MWQLTSTRDGIENGLLFADGRSPWFGDTSKLAARYTNDPYSADALVFKWVPKQLGGRFDSNPYAWWRYDNDPESDTYGTLTLGVDDHDSTTKYVAADDDTTVYGKNVTELSGTVDGIEYVLPWLQVTDDEATITDTSLPTTPNLVTKTIMAVTDVKNVVSFNGLLIDNPANWFAGYSAMESFDGTQMDVINATDISHMLQGTSSLISLTGNWNVSNVTDMSYFLNGASSLESIAALTNWT